MPQPACIVKGNVKCPPTTSGKQPFPPCHPQGGSSSVSNESTRVLIGHNAPFGEPPFRLSTTTPSPADPGSFEMRASVGVTRSTQGGEGPLPRIHHAAPSRDTSHERVPPRSASRQ